MVVRATGINPAMLRWAREQAGYSSIEQVASRLGRTPAEIEAWESGTDFPTWRQLERLARDLYHRPVALFLLPAPPEEHIPAVEFRMLPEKALDDLEPDTWLAIRQARARQLDLEELSQYDDTDARQVVQDLSGDARPSDVDRLAEEVRRYLNIAVDDQSKWSSDDDALNNWRDAVQASGVWVFKRHFRQRDIAGFCLYAPHHPLIYLNNGQPKVRQIFTLFHELAHLVFEFSYLERSDVGHYMASLEGHDRDVEIACNRFAGEFLVPSNHFENIIMSDEFVEPTDDALAKVAQKYWVSREVILRKYLDQGLIDRETYNERVEVWKSNHPVGFEGGAGGNYYASQGTYLGVKYTALAFRGYYQGAYDVDQLAEYLDIKASNVVGLENWLHDRLSSRQ